jgi:thiol-disulfide isomerase/thioredoxin
VVILVSKKKLALFLIVLVPLVTRVNIKSALSKPPSLDEPSQLPIDTDAPNFTLTDIILRETFSLTDFQGKVVILDLFTTWCGPCRQSIPQMKDIYLCYSEDELIIISVDIDTEEDELLVTDFILEYEMEWLVALDNNSVIDNNYGSGYIPTMYIIDQNQIGFNFEGVINTLDELSLEPLDPLPTYTSYSYSNDYIFSDMLSMFIFIMFIGIAGMVIVGTTIIIYVRHQRKKKTELFRASRLTYGHQQIKTATTLQKGMFFEFCPQCDHKLGYQAKFCPYCGSDLTKFP